MGQTWICNCLGYPYLHFLHFILMLKPWSQVKTRRVRKISKFKCKRPMIQPEDVIYSILALKKISAEKISPCLRKSYFNILESVSEGTCAENIFKNKPKWCYWLNILDNHLNWLDFKMKVCYNQNVFIFHCFYCSKFY